MKNTINLISKQSKAALVLGALTITAALGTTQAAQAAPNHGPAWGNQNRGRNHNDRQTFTGRVINDRGDNLFDIKINGKTYNVYTIRETTRRLSKGDLVRVTGKRVGTNDIREARVEIIRNR